MQANKRPQGDSPHRNQLNARGPINPRYRAIALNFGEENDGPRGGHPEAPAAAPRNFVALIHPPRPAHPVYAGILANAIPMHGRPEPVGPANGR
jgi:hypothetical protein